MKLFKRKKKDYGWDYIANRLAELEPKRMDRLVDIAKDLALLAKVGD